MIHIIKIMLLLLPTLAVTAPTKLHNASLAFRMVESTIARGQGLYSTAASTSLIELGIFQQALLESITATNNSAQENEWRAYLNESTTSATPPLSNATKDDGLPLDRLSVGTALIHRYESNHTDHLTPGIDALTQSVLLQQRNANGGLWYFANPDNISYYHNLSYLDGMFSYAPFAVSPTATGLVTLEEEEADGEKLFGPAAALKQLQILYTICKQPSGLLVHGYDASKAHSWSDPLTGASPVVWGRSLAWYTLGTLNALQIHSPAHTASKHTKSPGSSSISVTHITRLFNDVLSAQIAAAEHSFRTTGFYGVYQVVDRPGDNGNFVEASASCMTVYSLLRAARLHLIEDPATRDCAVTVALGIYRTVLETFLTEASNGTLSLSGTSSVASLGGESVDYEYYVSRPTANNSLIGTSAFVLASLEVERLA